MGKELEIKLSLAKQHSVSAWEWLAQQPDVRIDSSKHLRNIYFDTAEGLLNQRRVALRVRQAGDRFIQTLKSQGEFVEGVHRRNEWEWPLAEANLSPDLLSENSTLDGVNFDALQPVFETNFTRRTMLLDDQHTLIEAAFDSGEILAGDHRQPLNEIEFELKQGDPSGLLRWARALSQEVPLFLNTVSKAEQGYYLAGMAGSFPAFDGELSVHGFLQLLSACWLRHQPMPADGLDLAIVESVAEAAGLKDDFRQLVARLSSGIPVNELIEGGHLGRIQLAVAGEART